MASNQRRKRLDLTAGDTLTDIDDNLAWLVESVKKNIVMPGEFTAADAHKKFQQAGTTSTTRSTRGKLDQLVDLGILSKRKATINGNVTCLFLRVPGADAKI